MDSLHRIILPALMLMVMASIIAAQATGGDWSSFTLNNNDTRFQANSTINSYNVRNLSQNWMVNLSLGTTSTPVVVNGNVYITDWTGNVYSLNVATGSQNWVSDVGLGNAISSTPLVANGIVYVALGPNGPTQVYALNQTKGNIIWKINLNTTSFEVYTSPVLYHGILYLGAGGDQNDAESNVLVDGEMFALNASNGKTIWGFKTMIGNSGGAAVWSSVAIDPLLNSIYFATGNPYVQASPSQSLYGYAVISLNATNGKMNWYHQVYTNLTQGVDSDFGSTPNLFSVIMNGVNYEAVGIGNKNGIYYVLDRKTGKPLENFSIVSGSNDGIRGVAGLYYPSQYLSNPEIFVPSDYNSNSTTSKNGTIAAVYSSSGFIPWRFITPGILTGSVAVIPGAVLFGDYNGNLYALSIANGSVLFHAKLNGRIAGGVTVAEGHVLVGTVFGSNLGLYAFSPQASLNQTISQMISALRGYGFTNISTSQQIATASPPAVIFSAFDKNAYGPGSGGNVIILALPLGYEYKNTSAANPASYTYTDPAGKSLTGTIYFESLSASDFAIGTSSGMGNWVTWKELIPARGQNGPGTQDTKGLQYVSIEVLVGIIAVILILALILREANKRLQARHRH